VSVDVAVIDSGINPWHSHVGPIQGGLGFILGSDGRVIPDADFRDEIGHGTAIAGIIRGRVPAAHLYAMKIFRRELRVSLPVLEAALKWAVDSDLRIIHLSLGTVRGESGQLLSDLCRNACEKGLIIVAAATSLSEQIYPATLETVIGVTWDRRCSESDLVFFPGSSIEFGACGHPRPLPGMAPDSNFSGSSFAAAHVTARVACILESRPLADLADIKKLLMGEASSRCPLNG
jgi:subtilisin family serine protease